MLNRSITYQGKELELAERVGLYDLLICITTKTPPLDEKYDCFLDEARKNFTLTEDKEQVERDIFYKLTKGYLTAFGRNVTYSFWEKGIPDDLPTYNFYPSSSDFQQIEPSLWKFEKIIWEKNALVTSSLDDYSSVGFMANHDGKAFAEIEFNVEEAGRLWPFLLCENKEQAPSFKQSSNSDFISELKSRLYVSPYLELMLNAVIENEISEETFSKKEVLVDWFKRNWPKDLQYSDKMTDTMATLIRHPAAQKGGNKRTKK